MSRRLTALVVVVSSAAPVTARADESLHATLGLTSGYTDNVLTVPGNPTTFVGAPPVEDDFFSTLSPGLTFTHEGPRLVQVASFVFSSRLYVQRDEANSYSSNLSYGASYPLSPNAELGLTLTAANGRSNAFDLAPADTPVQARPTGDFDFWTAGASGSYRLDVNRDWRVTDVPSVSGFRPTAGSDNLGSSFLVSNVLGLERTWGHDLVAGLLRTHYTSNEVFDMDGNRNGSNTAVQAGPEVRWMHDLSPSLTTDTAAGLAVIIRASDFKRGSIVPTASAFLRYTRDFAAAAIGYRHFVDTNIFTATTSVNHVVEARGGLPLDRRERLALTGVVGYGRGRFLDLEAQTLAGRNEFVVADAALVWSFDDATALTLRYGLRRQVNDQPPFSDAELTVRRDVMLTLQARYPSREAARIPRQPGGRADRSDEIEAEPVGGRAQPGR